MDARDAARLLATGGGGLDVRFGEAVSVSGGDVGVVFDGDTIATPVGNWCAAVEGSRVLALKKGTKFYGIARK